MTRRAHLLLVTPTLLPRGSSKFGSFDGSAPDLDGMGVRFSSTMEDSLTDILTMLVQLDALSQWVSKFDLHLNTISTSVGNLTTKFAELEQNLGTLAARVLASEGRNGSASCVSGSPAGSWPLPDHNGRSTATGRL